MAPDVSGNGIFIDKRTPAASRAAATSALVAKASASGTIRVIAGINVTLQAPHELSGEAAERQTQTLGAAQSSLLTRVIGPGASSASATNFEHIPYVAMNVTAAQLNRLIADSEVVSVQEDVAVPPNLTQSVPFINANDVWSAGFDGGGFTVAILDTGVDKTHDMFPGRKVVSEACYSTKVAGQSTSVCPGGVSSSTAAGSGMNCPHPAVSGCNHGTHVAGIAAGKMTSPRLFGVARGSDIIAVQVFSRFNSSANCGSTPAPCVLSYNSDQIRGLERVYALRNRFDIAAVNMSLGGGQFFAPCDTQNAAQKAIIDLLRGVKIATVISSGNNGFNGSMGSPGCISSAISVGSTLDTANVLSDFSNHAGNVRLLAPGSNIESSVPPGLKTTAVFNGTSMAAPHVTGAFALLRDVKGGSTVDDIAAALECTGVPVTRAGITEPRIDVDAARAYLLNPPNDTKSFSFNAASQAANWWTPLAGSWQTHSSGVYRVAPITTGPKLSTTANCNEDVTITSRVRRAWASGEKGNSGIVFKAQVSATNKTVHGYMAAINRDLPGDNHAQNVVLWRFDGVNMQNGAGNATLLCSANLAITTNRYYDLKVVSRGGLHRFYVNDVLRCTATDRAYGTGRAGLIAFFVGAAGNSFQADSFVINPNETVPASAAATAAAQ